MRQTILLASTLLVACAASEPRNAQNVPTGNAAGFVAAPARASEAEPGAPAPAAAPGASSEAASESFTAVKTVTSQEADNGRVCEKRTRPGSHMTQTFCYTREQYAANQAERDEAVRQQLDELQREQRLQEEMRRQMEMERQRRQGAFGGRN